MNDDVIEDTRRMAEEATKNTVYAPKYAVDQAIVALSDALFLQKGLASEKETQRKQIIPEEVQLELGALEEEYAQKELLVAARVTELTEKAKEAVLAVGQTVEGAGLQLVYVKAKPKIDSKGMDYLTKYILDGHPELGYLVSMSKPSVSVRITGKVDLPKGPVG